MFSCLAAGRQFSSRGNVWPNFIVKWRPSGRIFGIRTVASSPTPQDKGSCPWVGLAGFAKSKEALRSWRELRSDDELVEALIQRYGADRVIPEGVEQSPINWNYWKKTIKHPGIVDCLQVSFESHLQFIDKALEALEQDKIVENDHVSIPNNSSYTVQQKLLDLHNKAARECAASVSDSGQLIADGARALWLLHRNPPAWKVAPDEWLDTDPYWQAYIERHHHFDPAKDIESFRSETFEDEAEQQANDKDWMRRVNLFHDRSDTPTLYSYMDHLHSSDYYDLHRRVFLEHMLYFLIRTGYDYHFFPEIPPVSWIVDMERLRYRYVSRAHERRLQRQLETLKREEPLDLCPVDSELEHGEEHFFALLSRERTVWEAAVGRWMMDYIFLCHPALPIQNQEMLYAALTTDRGKGTIHTLGDDVTALFYVPSTQSPPFTTASSLQHSAVHPIDAQQRFVEHLQATGHSVNAGYFDLLQLHAELLGKRGDAWFGAPHESVAEAFLRRFLPEDPQKEVYEDYVEQLKARWASAEKLTLNEALGMLPEIERTTRESLTIFEIARLIVSPELTESQQFLQELLHRCTSDALEQLLSDLNSARFTLRDDPQRSATKERLDTFLKTYEQQKNKIAESIMNTKL